METLMDDENIAAVVACLYMACAYAGGQQWLDRANTVLDSYSADPEMPPQAAEMLAVIATAMRAANNAEMPARTFAPKKILPSTPESVPYLMWNQ